MTDTIVNNIAPTPKPTGEIAKALAAFQAAIPAITKDGSADAGRYAYTYATLDKLVSIIFPLLAAQGLAYTAVPDWTALGFGLRTSLLHVSGEEITGFYPLGSPTNPAQAIGSAISYARRYALLSLTGVAPAGEDDDGKSANDAQTAALTTPAASSSSDDSSVAETAASIRTEMGDTIENSKGLLKVADANAVMKQVTSNAKTPEGKETANWTLADMKKGRTALNALLEERKAAQGGK